MIDPKLDGATQRQCTYDPSPNRDLETEARNDACFTSKAEPPNGLSTAEKIEAAFTKMSDAPMDLPSSGDAKTGLCIALSKLVIERPAVEAIRASIAASLMQTPIGAAKGATILSLNRRKGRHLLYGLLREIGCSKEGGNGLCEDALKLVALWCTRQLIDAHQPTADSIAKVRVALLYPTDRAALSWSGRARTRALCSAGRGLDNAIEAHANVAASFGLAASKTRLPRIENQVEKFNRAYRRRVENLIDFAALDAVACAGGHGTLSEGALQDNGVQLLNMALSGDRGSLVVCLEVVTYLPSDTVLQIPLKTGESVPPGALAWLDLQEGTYCQILYRLKERGAKVPIGCDGLFESACYVVATLLSPPIHKLLLELAAAFNGQPVALIDLTGPTRHHPRSKVAGEGGYRVTARRIQETLPTLLIQQGFHRWPVALATTSHYLVSVGRRAYGVCRSVEIDKVARATHRMLGWPVRTDSSRSALVGSPVTPRSETVRRCLNSLADQANACGQNFESVASIAELLNT